MKLNLTDEQQRAIAGALKPLHISLYTHKSCTPKWNAQQNLQGRTHYVDDDTLRWHHSRVLSSSTRGWGLLFSITTSDAADMHNSKRGFRCVVFDVFGTVVYRPDLEGMYSTRKAAENARDRFEFDLLAHYQKAIADKLEWNKREWENLSAAALALDTLAQPVTANA